MSARPRRRKRPATRRRARRWLRRQDRFTRTLLALVGILAVLVVALMLPHLGSERTERTAVAPATPPGHRPPVATRRAPSPAAATRPRRAVAEPSASAPGTTSRPPHPATSPRLAIVIDDLGQRFSHLEQVAGLDIPLSVAVIPGLPASARTVREARRRGIEILLHQPMEPREEGGKNPGEGVLLTSMSADAIRERVRNGLAAVPGAVGVNNHMGSRFTEDAGGVGALMAELREHGLFWLDSRTTAATVGLAAARSHGVPAIERDVFIDAEVSEDFIRGQLRKLIETARVRGSAVGIGHPHPETLAALREMRAELIGSGVTLVPVSALAPTAAPAVSAPPGPALISAAPGTTPAAPETATP